MKIYSHPIFRVQGRDFPGREHPDRLEGLSITVQNAEHAFSEDDEESADYIEQIGELHDYVEDLRHRGHDYRSIDEEGETFVDRLSYRAAMAAAITSIHAAEERGFALVRPPGHHAHQDKTHGFCLLNNMAIAAKHLIKNGERVLVLDVDVHHGCGTEELLQNEKDAYMISMYSKGLWPSEEHFVHARNCLHIPLEGVVNDKRYGRVLTEQVMPKIETFNPTVIGVSLGLDTFADEQYGWQLTKKAIKNLRRCIDRKDLFGVLEGGYTCDAVRRGVLSFTNDPEKTAISSLP